MRQGVSNMRRNRASAAFAAFNLASQLDPGFAEPHNKLAALHHKAGEQAQCAQRARLCLELLPQHYGALAGLAMSLERSGDLAGAVVAIREALSLHPFASHLPTVLNGLLMDIADKHKEGVTSPSTNDDDKGKDKLEVADEEKNKKNKKNKKKDSSRKSRNGGVEGSVEGSKGGEHDK